MIVCVIISATPCAAAENSAVLLMEASSGFLLYSQNENIRLPMASLTKIMTAYTVIQNADLNQTVTVGKESVGIEGSSMYLTLGQQLTVEQLLYGLMLASGNDAASALAVHVGGSIEGFADLMNEQAAQLGLRNSHFVNPSGLDEEDHYTTALDLAKLTAVALENEQFARIVSTSQYKIGNTVLTNHNRLLRELNGCIGVKTGYTKACGRCLVSAVERDGVRLICVTLNCSDDWNVHKTLYSQHFSRCVKEVLLQKKEIYRALSVVGGYDAGYYCDEICGVVIDGNRDFEYRLSLPDFVYLPGEKDQPIGKVTVYRDGIAVAEGKLRLDRTLTPLPKKKSNFGKLLDFILHLFGF